MKTTGGYKKFLLASLKTDRPLKMRICGLCSQAANGVSCRSNGKGPMEFYCIINGFFLYIQEVFLLNIHTHLRKDATILLKQVLKPPVLNCVLFPTISHYSI